MLACSVTYAVINSSFFIQLPLHLECFLFDNVFFGCSAFDLSESPYCDFIFLGVNRLSQLFIAEHFLHFNVTFKVE